MILEQTLVMPSKQVRSCRLMELNQMADVNGNWLMLILTLDNFKFILISTYGYKGSTGNKNLFEQTGLQLDNMKSTYSADNVIIGGACEGPEK